MSCTEWINIKETGQLYMEKVLVYFNIPILFVCNDFENRKYICLNIDEEIGQYIIAEITNAMLIQMLQDEVSIEYVFRNCINNKIIFTEYDYQQKIIKTLIFEAEQISDELLPEKNAYLESREFNDYINILREDI